MEAVRCGPVERRGLQEARQWPDRSGPPGPGDRAIRPACTMPVIRLVHRCAGGSDRPGSGGAGRRPGGWRLGAPAGPAGAPDRTDLVRCRTGEHDASSTVYRGRAPRARAARPERGQCSSWSLDPCERPSAQPAAGIVHRGATSDQDRGQPRCRRSAPRPTCLGVSDPADSLRRSSTDTRRGSLRCSSTGARRGSLRRSAA
jgi:hypothetical protein